MRREGLFDGKVLSVASSSGEINCSSARSGGNLKGIGSFVHDKVSCTIGQASKGSSAGGVIKITSSPSDRPCAVYPIVSALIVTPLVGMTKALVVVPAKGQAVLVSATKPLVCSVADAPPAA